MNFTLTPDGIAAAVSRVEEFLSAKSAEHDSALRARLAVEEVCLFYSSQFGSAAICKLELVRRFGRLRVRLAVEGLPKDPRADETDMVILGRLIQFEDFTPRWSWSGGINTVDIPVRPARRRLSPTALLLLMCVLGLATGGLATLAPAEPVKTVITYADRIFGLILDVMKGVAGPFIFVSVAYSICAIGSLTVFNRLGLRLFACAVSLLVGVTGLAALFSRCFVSSGAVAAASGGGTAGLSDFLFGLIPVNLFAPFVQGSLPQILVLAFIVGRTMLALGDRVHGLVDFFEQLKMVLTGLLRLVLDSLMPILVLCCTFSMVASGRLSVLLESWKISVLVLVVSLIAISAIILVTCVRFRESPISFLVKAWPAIFASIPTGSSTATMPVEMRLLKDEFGVKPDFVGFAEPFILPFSLFAYAIQLGVMLVCMGADNGLALTTDWLALLVMIVPLAVISTPSVPGGGGLVLGMLCSQLGIRTDCVGIMIALSIVFDYAFTWVSVCTRLCLVRNIARTIEGRG